VSIQDLRPSPQDTPTFYLRNIYQILADPNVTVPPTPTPFSPPRYAVFVNSLWILSFIISLACALLAISLQQWGHRYIRVTQPTRCNPEKRARVRAFFAGGVEKMYLPFAVEALPALLHLSVFLFFSGLVIFLLNVNNDVYLSAIWALGFFSAVYAFLTLMPMFRPDSPYYTPLSIPVFLVPFVLQCVIATVLLVLFICSLVVVLLCLTLYLCFVLVWIIVCPSTRLSRRLKDWLHDEDDGFFQLMDHMWRIFCHIVDFIFQPDWEDRILKIRNEAGEITFKQPSVIDQGILDWIIGALGEDDALEKFFEAIPGFFGSPMVKNLKSHLPETFRSKFTVSWGGFLARNLLSNSVSDEIKTRRLVICMNAIKEMCNDDGPSNIFCHLTSLRFDQTAPSIRTAEILTPWCASSDSVASGLAQYTVAKILPYVRERDARWIALAGDVFGLPERILRYDIARGDDSVLLSIFLHTSRQVIRTEHQKWELLPSISKFDIRNTLPGLQNEFCTLWNEIVREARDRKHPHLDVLRGIRHLYIALHRGTNAAPNSFDASTDEDSFDHFDASDYPLCNLATHHPDSTAVSPPAQLDDHDDISLHPSCLDSHPTPGSMAPQQAEEANIVPGLPSSSGHISRHAPAFPPPSLTTDPINIIPQVTLDVDPSIHKRIDMVALDLQPLISTAVSHPPCQSSLSIADLPADNTRIDEPTPDVPINETGCDSQTLTATLILLPHPVAVLATVPPPISPRPPHLFVEQPGHFLVTPKHITLTVMSFHPLDSDKEKDTAVPHAASDSTEISTVTNQTQQHIPDVDIALQISGESADPNRSIVSGSLSLPISMPALHNHVIPVEPPSSVGSMLVTPDHASPQ